VDRGLDGGSGVVGSGFGSPSPLADVMTGRVVGRRSRRQERCRRDPVRCWAGTRRCSKDRAPRSSPVFVGLGVASDNAGRCDEPVGTLPLSCASTSGRPARRRPKASSVHGRNGTKGGTPEPAGRPAWPRSGVSAPPEERCEDEFRSGRRAVFGSEALVRPVMKVIVVMHHLRRGPGPALTMGRPDGR